MIVETALSDDFDPDWDALAEESAWADTYSEDSDDDGGTTG